VTGWRLGWVHAPSAIIDKMATIQQFSYVCAPHPFQWAGLAALDVDMSAQAAEYARRRDLFVRGLREAGYEVACADGAFYLLPKVPPGRGTGQEFVARAIENNLLLIPGGVFSRRDTHFRISYAVSERTIERALEVLRRLR
jgi:aspartate aminotransferase/aminotransferase